MASSGWCTAPPGIKAQHVQCKYEGCTCWCHQKKKVKRVKPKKATA